jgi:glycosyltransferase involved in cell wall biosynthesis
LAETGVLGELSGKARGLGRRVKASIVIRTFNSERTIRQVLEGVRFQALNDYELVIVDSGSTDGTLSIVQDYPHAFVDYSGERFTYGGSLNAGCSVAQGEYVVCLSHHCVPLHREWLGELVAAMEENEQLAGAYGPLLFDVGDYGAGQQGIRFINEEEFRRRPNQGLQNPNSIIRRELWEEYPFSHKLERCEDQDWARHFMQLGYKTAVVYRAPVLYTPSFSFYYYAVNNYKNAQMLAEHFDYGEWRISTSELLQSSARMIRSTTLGKRPLRTTKFAISSMMGRWVADKAIRYGKAFALVDQSAKASDKMREKVLTAGVKKAIKQIERGISEAVHPPIVRENRNRRLTSAESKDVRFFVVGEMRSGTSWLARTLDSHPQVFCRGEGSFFGRNQAEEEIPVYKGPTPSLYNALAECEGLRTWRSLEWNAWGRGGQEEDFAELTRLAIEYFLKKGAASSGKSIIGDKSPLHTDDVEEIHELFPEAKVVHIYRDGRDVAVSLMHHFWRLSKDKGGIFELEPEELRKRDAYLENPEGFVLSGESIFIEERLKQMAVRWNRRISKASRNGAYLFGRDFYQLSYEELLKSPEEHLKAIFELLGASADDETVSRCIESNDFERLAERSQGQEDSGSFFRKGVAGDWRNVFTESDRRIYEEIAGETLLRMGYDVD